MFNPPPSLYLSSPHLSLLFLPPLPPHTFQLHVAAANGYADVLNFLLSQDNINLDVQDTEGWTPFHAAVCWEQQEAMRLLAEKGASMDIKNLHGETAYGGWFNCSSTP